MPLLGLACDAESPTGLDIADTEAVLDEADSTGFDAGSEESGSTGDDLDADLEPDADGFVAEVDPSAAWVNFVGSTGGTSTTGFCPSGFSAIGVGVSSTGLYVRQLVLLCGPDLMIEDRITVSSSSQYVLASGYYNPGGVGGVGASLVASSENWRPVWEAADSWWLGASRYKAPGTSFHQCDDGYKLRSINARAGTYVDRIVSGRCLWDGPGASGPRGTIYTMPVDVGGPGGTADASECWTPGAGGRFAYAINFRSGYWLDGFVLNCHP